MRNLRLMLDANVLVDAQLRDIFLRLAEQGYVDFYWSAGLIAELRSVLAEKMARPPERVGQLCDDLRRAFPAGEAVPDDGLADHLIAPDPGDQHVLSAAISSEIDLLVTYDRRGFPPDDELARWDLAVLPPDDALGELVTEFGATVIATAFKQVTAALRRPAISLHSQLERLAEKAPFAALVIRAELNLPWSLPSEETPASRTSFAAWSSATIETSLSPVPGPDRTLKRERPVTTILTEGPRDADFLQRYLGWCWEIDETPDPEDPPEV